MVILVEVIEGEIKMNNIYFGMCIQALVTAFYLYYLLSFISYGQQFIAFLVFLILALWYESSKSKTP